MDKEVSETLAQPGAFQATAHHFNYEFFEQFHPDKLEKALGTAPILTSVLERVAMRDRRDREGVDPDNSRMHLVRFFSL